MTDKWLRVGSLSTGNLSVAVSYTEPVHSNTTVDFYVSSSATSVSFDYTLLSPDRFWDSVTASDSLGAFSIGKAITEDIDIDDAYSSLFSTAFTDSVTISDSNVKVVSHYPDFDTSDADIDFDPVTMSDTSTISIGKNLTETVTSSDTIAKTISVVFTDSTSLSDLFGVDHTLFVFDGVFPSQGPFIETFFNAQSLYSNNSFAQNDRVGTINGPGLLGMNAPMLSNSLITYTISDGFSSSLS